MDIDMDENPINDTPLLTDDEGTEATNDFRKKA
jgi:hypothetical protein